MVTTGWGTTATWVVDLSIKILVAYKLIVNKQCHAVAEKAHQMHERDCCHYGKHHNPCRQLCASKQHSACFWPAYFKTEPDNG